MQIATALEDSLTQTEQGISTLNSTRHWSHFQPQLPSVKCRLTQITVHFLKRYKDKVNSNDPPKNIYCKQHIKLYIWFTNEWVFYDSSVNINFGLVQNYWKKLWDIASLLDQQKKTMIVWKYLLPKFTYGRPHWSDERVLNTIHKLQWRNKIKMTQILEISMKRARARLKIK